MVSEAHFPAMTVDRHDKLAATDHSMTAVALTPSRFVQVLKAIPVWLYFSSLLFCSVLCSNTRLYIVYECQLCLSFITVRKLGV